MANQPRAAEPPPAEPTEADPQLEEPMELPEGAPEVVASRPGFPSSLRIPRPNRPQIPPDEATGPEESSDPVTGSSKGSTDPDRGRGEWAEVDPKDLRAAVTQLADIGFVLVGQGLGTFEKRARRLEAVDRKWVPTRAERAMVSEPVARIAKRHISLDHAAMDTIDGCLIGVGVGSFALRGLFDLEPLGATSEPS